MLEGLAQGTFVLDDEDQVRRGRHDGCIGLMSLRP